MDSGIDVVRPVLAVGFVLVLLFGLLRLARGYTRVRSVGHPASLGFRALGFRALGFRALGFQAKPPGLIQILESRALGPQHVLHLVRVGDRALILAAHPAGCALVESRPAAEVGAAESRGERTTCDPACASS